MSVNDITAKAIVASSELLGHSLKYEGTVYACAIDPNTLDALQEAVGTARRIEAEVYMLEADFDTLEPTPRQAGFSLTIYDDLTFKYVSSERLQGVVKISLQNES